MLGDTENTEHPFFLLFLLDLLQMQEQIAELKAVEAKIEALKKSEEYKRLVKFRRAGGSEQEKQEWMLLNEDSNG